MIYKFWKPSPTPSPVDSFAETAFSVDHLEGRHTPKVKLPPPPRSYQPRTHQHAMELSGSYQREDSVWNVHFGDNPFWEADRPAVVESTSTDIFLPEDVEITGEVKTRPVVRLPCPPSRRVTFDDKPQSKSVGADVGQAQAPSLGVSEGPGFRLRRRGRLTRCLEAVALEDYYNPHMTGGKTSSEAVRSYLDGILRKGVKLNWLEQVVTNLPKEGEASYDVVLNLSAESYTSLVSLRVLNKLLSKAMFKKRTLELRASLTAKAVQFAAELGLSDSYLSMVLPGTVTHAMFVTMHEATAAAELGGWVGLVSREQSDAISQGRVPKGRTETFTESFRRFMSGKPVETVLPHAKT